MVSAGRQLIFFVEAGVMLCLRFLMKIVVETHWYFGCCRAVHTELRTFLLLLLL